MSAPSKNRGMTLVEAKHEAARVVGIAPQDVPLGAQLEHASSSAFVVAGEVRFGPEQLQQISTAFLAASSQEVGLLPTSSMTL